jgi:DNA polymerase-3 subunit epsilon
VLCTVKLSRRLYPQEPRHNLDSIIRRHGLACAARHRALGDAHAMLAFVEHVRRTLPPDDIEAAVTAILRRPALPPGLRESDLDELPDTPGVYLFYDARDVLLYVGKSIHLRARILSHFSAGQRSRVDARIVQQVARIETLPTAGELGALLLEARLVKQRQPLHNRCLRQQYDLVALHWDAGTPGALPTLVSGNRLDAATLPEVYGVFRSRHQARNALHELATAHALCLKRLGLEAGSGACSAHRLQQCRGVCAGREDELRHHLRMVEALSALRPARWPWPGAIGIREHCVQSGREEIHVIDRWCYLGAVRDTGRLQELLEDSRRAAFDPDTYRLLLRYLQRHPRPVMVPLPAAAAPREVPA